MGHIAFLGKSLEVVLFHHDFGQPGSRPIGLLYSFPSSFMVEEGIWVCLRHCRVWLVLAGKAGQVQPA